MASPNQNWKPLHLSDGQVLYVSKRDDIWFRNNQTGNVGLAVSPAIGTFTADATGLVTIRGRKAAGNVAINITADAGEIDIVTPNYITLSSGEDCTLTLSSSRTHSGTAINITAPGAGADILVTAGHNITLTATGTAQVAGTSISKLTSGSSNISASPTGIGVLSGGSINITSNSAAIAIASQGGTITLNAGTAGTVAITGNSSPNFTIFGESFHPETGATNGNVISRVAGVWQGVAVSTLGFLTTALTTAHILVGSAGGVATDVAMSGDVTITSAGVTAIKSGVALAGVPTAATAAVGTNTTQIATTAFVLANALVNTLTATNILVGSAGNVATSVAMSGDVTIVSSGATTIKTSVSLAGSPTTTTQSQRDNSTKIATTAYVDRAAGDSAWTTYTPALIQSSAVASANTAVGSSQFKLIGKTMFVTVDVKPSATGTATAAIQVGLPSSADSPGGSVPTNQDSSAGVMGFGQFALGGTVYRGLCIFSGVSGVTPLFTILRTDTTVNGAVGSVAPTTAITSSDRLLANLTYQVN